MCPSFSAAMKAGKPVYTDAQPSLADGLAVPKVSLQLNNNKDMVGTLNLC